MCMDNMGIDSHTHVEYTMLRSTQTLLIQIHRIKGCSDGVAVWTLGCTSLHALCHSNDISLHNAHTLRRAIDRPVDIMTRNSEPTTSGYMKSRDK